MGVIGLYGRLVTCCDEQPGLTEIYFNCCGMG